MISSPRILPLEIEIFSVQCASVSPRVLVGVMSLVLNGEDTHLRPLRESDSEYFCVWDNDEQASLYLGMKPLSKEKAKTVFNQFLSDPDGVYFGVIKRDEERIISYVFHDDKRMKEGQFSLWLRF